ncbi:DPP IV N-terminal domain-containing protein, partial [Flavobacteriales bacterium]|nr:DPP IV N-terminal domain-containing protein [Flavobacteriales bacterium]
MKNTLLLLFTFSSFLTFSQLEETTAKVDTAIQEIPDLKELSLKDAVLGYYKGLYPSGISELKMIDGTDDYIYYTKKSYFIKDAATQTEKMKLDVDFFKKDFPEMKSVPRILEINNEVMVINKGDKFIIYNYAGDNKGNKISIVTPEGSANHSFNLKAQAVAYTIDNNLYLATAKNMQIIIFENEDKNIVTGQAIHRYEFGISKGIFWSPEGNYVAYYQKDETDVADYPLLNINVTPGEVNSIKYPMAGQMSEYGKVGIYNLKKGNKGFLGLVKRKLSLKTGGEKDDHYLTNVTWGPNEDKFYIAEVNRGQNHMHFNEYSVKGKNLIRTVFEEKHDKWMEPENPGFFPTKDENTMLWLSEKDGNMNMYKVNMTNGSWTALTNFNFPITSYMGLTIDGTQAFVQATGTDGREKHIYKVEIESGKTVQLSTVKGNHSAIFSSTGNYIIDTYSNTETPKVVQVIETSTIKKSIIKT